MNQTAKEVVPPKAQADPETCNHLLAGPRMHRCPMCQSIMRRCCQSRLGGPHEEDCTWALAMRSA